MGSTVTQVEAGLREVFRNVGGEGLEDVGFYCKLHIFTTYIQDYSQVRETF
jgi:hypothetical protein